MAEKIKGLEVDFYILPERSVDIMKDLNSIKKALLLYIAATILEKVLKSKRHGIKLSINKDGSFIENY